MVSHASPIRCVDEPALKAVRQNCPAELLYACNRLADVAQSAARSCQAFDPPTVIMYVICYRQRTISDRY